jgi:lysophospholipase L1-like esterase
MRFLKLLAVNFLVLFFLLAAFEWVLEKVNPDERHHSVLSRYISLREIALPNSHFTEMPHHSFQRYTENLEIKNYTVDVDENGFIRSETILPEAKANILFIGGSTTECRYVDDSLRFPSLIGKKLQQAGYSVNTFNSGVAGNHSLHSLNILTNKILHHDFQVAILMHGINDLVHLSYNGSFTSDEKTPTRRNIETVAKPDFDDIDFYFFRKKGVFKRLEKSFQVLFPRLHYELLSVKVKVSSQQQPLEFGWEKLQPIHEKQFEEYKNNLRSFVALCRADNITPVLMTQFNRVLEKEFSENPIYQPYTEKLRASGTSVPAFCDSYQKMNDIVREVAQEENVLLIDLDAEIPKSKDYLYDMVHLHGAGSVKVAEVVFRELEKAVFNKNQKGAE